MMSVDDSDTDSEREYAHVHIPRMLELPKNNNNNSSSSGLQYVSHGSTLTAEALRSGRLSLHQPILVLDTPESIGMRLPQLESSRKLTVRDIANIISPSMPVDVIDVKYQEELAGWTLADLADYFEDEERLLEVGRREQQVVSLSTAGLKRRRRQVHTRRPPHAARQRILNQISLEFSQTRLAKHVQSPAFVRELDWIDHAWRARWATTDPSLNKDTHAPHVQYYCLTSAAGCFTDFHVDFGGTTVWYHVLSGSKVFRLIPPSQANLKQYEAWLCRKDQSLVFLPDLLDNPSDVLTVSLQERQTLVIPSGWIHAVYTPQDSLVFGGNFLHGLDMKLQLEVNSIESRSKVKDRFRFPNFVALQFYAGGMYLHKLREGKVCQREVDELPALTDALHQWWQLYRTQTQARLADGPTPVSAAQLAAQVNGCESVDSFLAELQTEHARVVRDGLVPNPTRPKVALKVAVPPVSCAAPAATSLSPTSPRRIKLKLSASHPRAKGEDDDSKFRIRLAASSLRSAPIADNVIIVAPPGSATKAKEDTEWVDEDEVLRDDEWEPEPRERPISVSSRRRSTGQRGRSRDTLSRPAKKAKPTSARQRLLKKVGF